MNIQVSLSVIGISTHTITDTVSNGDLVYYDLSENELTNTASPSAV